MQNVKLILANSSYKKQYIDFIQECREDIISRGFEFSIPISDNETFESDIKRLSDIHHGQGLPEGWVPGSVFWLCNDVDGKIIGVITIRPKLNEYLKFRGGHISYYVRPSERNKGYATLMLSLGLEYCRSIGLTSVLITCSKDNIYSAKTIMNNGGILDSEDNDNGRIFQRYVIHLQTIN